MKVNSYMHKRDFYVFFIMDSRAWIWSEDSFIVDNSPDEKPSCFVCFYKIEYYLTVIFPVHLIIVGSILPLNIL